MSNIRRLSIFCPKIKYTGIECTVYPVKWTYVQLQSRLPHQPKKTNFSENLVCVYFVTGLHIIQLRLASYRDLINPLSVMGLLADNKSLVWFRPDTRVFFFVFFLLSCIKLISICLFFFFKICFFFPVFCFFFPKWGHFWEIPILIV